MSFNKTKSLSTIAAAKFDRTYGIKSIWLDSGAEFKKAHVQGTKLATFFAKGTGPKEFAVNYKGFWEEVVAKVTKDVGEQLRQQIRQSCLRPVAPPQARSKRRSWRPRLSRSRQRRRIKGWLTYASARNWHSKKNRRANWWPSRVRQRLRLQREIKRDSSFRRTTSTTLATSRLHLRTGGYHTGSDTALKFRLLSWVRLMQGTLLC